MKTILKNLFIASLLLASMTASAQSQMLEELPTMLQKEFDITMKKSINYEGDVHTRMLKSRCDIYTFTLTKKQQEKVFQGMLDGFEGVGHNDKNCYSVNSMNDLTGKESLRNLIIGDDPNRHITIGQDYNNYINVNILDEKDTTKTHRYAYALEWREQSGTSEKGAIDVRYIITYAKIPSTYTATVSYPSLSVQNPSISGFIKERIRSPKSGTQQAPNKAQAWYLNKNPITRIEDKLSLSNGDTVFVVTSKINGENGVWLPNDPREAVNDMLCNDNVLLMFSNLKQYYNNHQNAELTAISIYTLCKHANVSDFFTDPRSFEELEQLMCEMDVLIENAKTETDRKYFQMAREQLEQILKKKR